ncbi:unnamed protein product, partial [Ectocarpus sp. 12 AP-2014]
RIQNDSCWTNNGRLAPEPSPIHVSDEFTRACPGSTCCKLGRTCVWYNVIGTLPIPRLVYIVYSMSSEFRVVPHCYAHEFRSGTFSSASPFLCPEHPTNEDRALVF